MMLQRARTKLKFALKKTTGVAGAILDMTGSRAKRYKKGTSAKRRKKRLKQKSSLPPVLEVIPYAMSIMTFFIAGYFTILYGLKFPEEMESAWLESVGVSLLQELVLQQVIKVMALAFLQSIVLPATLASIVNRIAQRAQATMPTTDQI
mmetsp:Transcript_50277/g.129423  ORF Transcript_50277/g.129423 Transcript_50277/m.129423 type:complete len:149 (-) Transcript_50277:174-620(-)